MPHVLTGKKREEFCCRSSKDTQDCLGVAGWNCSPTWAAACGCQRNVCPQLWGFHISLAQMAKHWLRADPAPLQAAKLVHTKLPPVAELSLALTQSTHRFAPSLQPWVAVPRKKSYKSFSKQTQSLCKGVCFNFTFVMGIISHNLEYTDPR